MKYTIILFSIFSFMIANNASVGSQKYEINKQMFQVVWEKAMEAKLMYKNNQSRDEILSNLASTAPREEFIVNVDLSPELLAANPQAKMFLSTDNQNTWIQADAYQLNELGYENTWEAIVPNNGGQNIHWYLSGEADSEPLGFDYGRILVSQTPFHENNSFPPPSSHYALLATDESGDASSSQDIFDLRGTYSNNNIFMSMGISGGCCDEDGGWLGPWYLYGVAIVNPEAEDAIAYAIGYGDGGFGQLSPGLYKISGDLATGEVSGFDKIGDLANYSTAGNYMQAAIDLIQITNDSDWGPWPNSFEGFIALGVTVEAGLDGFDIAITPLDQTSPGLMIMATQSQNGNNDCVLSEEYIDIDNQKLSINYIDNNNEEGNMPWFRSVQLCETEEDGGLCFYQDKMNSYSHTYLDGTSFEHTFSNIPPVDDGVYVLKIGFADGEFQGYQVEREVNLLNGIIDDGSGCLVGDSNGDGTLNVLDVVLSVNAVLCGTSCYNSCNDINTDGTLNVLDIVLLVGIVLGS